MEKVSEQVVGMVGTQQIAEALGVSRRQAAMLCRTRELRGRKVGKVWRVPRSELARFMLMEGA